MRVHKILAASIFSTVLWLGGPANQTANAAFSVPLSTLLSGGTETFGGLTFSNFQYTPSGTNPVAAANITIQSYTDGGGLSGIQIVAAFNQTTAGSSDVLLTYTVSGTALTDIHLTGNPTTSPGGGAGGLAQVTETVYSGSGVVGGPIQIFQSPGGSSASSSTTFTPPGPYSSLTVQKDILVTSNGTTSASISHIEQTFSTTVPEPASVVMMGLGVGIGGVMLRRRMTVTA